MTQFARTLERYRKDFADRLPFLSDSPPTNLGELLRYLPGLRPPALDSALRLVSDLKDRRAVLPLIELLRDGDLQQAEPLAQTIATLGGSQAAPALLQVLGTAREPQRRWAAAYALTWLMDEHAFEPLLGLLQDRAEPDRLRTQAAEALTYLLGDVPRADRRWQSAAAAFLAGLKEPSADLRFWCIYALGMLRAEQALPQLREIVQHDRAIAPSNGAELAAEAEDAIAAIQQEHRERQ